MMATPAAPRTDWLKLTLVLLLLVQFGIYTWYIRQSSGSGSSSYVMQVHQMFRPSIESVDQIALRNVLIKAEDNLLNEFMQAEIGMNRHQNDVLPSSKRHILVFSFWRSGSTFLYDLISSFPGTYGYFEPLAPIFADDYDLSKQRNSSLRVELKSRIKDFYLCNLEHEKYSSYFKYLGESNDNINVRFLEACFTRDDLNSVQCLDPKLHKLMCQTMPVVVQKIVRLDSGFIPELLEEENLDLKIVVLMRDPRAMMMSRRQMEFCVKSPRCMDASLTCMEMDRTLDQVAKCQEAHHHRLYFLRYEDLMGNLVDATRDLFAFLDLPVTHSVSQFLQSHTNLTSDKARQLSEYSFSTYRNSSRVLTQWREDNSFHNVHDVQLKCRQVLDRLKYKIFSDLIDYKNARLSNIL